MISTDLLSVLVSLLSVLLLGGLYYLSYRQQKRQSNLQELAYIPRLEVDLQDVDGSMGEHTPREQWFSLKNGGEVPFVASISLSLVRYDNVQSDSAFLDPEESFESIPDEFKFTDAWQNESIFLNPQGQQNWVPGMFYQELERRGYSSSDDAPYLLRVDAELESTLESVNTRSVHRIFHLKINEPIEMHALTFEQARERAARMWIP